MVTNLLISFELLLQPEMVVECPKFTDLVIELAKENNPGLTAQKTVNKLK